MPVVRESTILEVPIEQVWAYLSDFSKVSVWHPGVPRAEMENGSSGNAVPCVRRLQMANGLYRERLLDLSAIDHTYTYELFESPLPISGHTSTVSLHAVTDRNQTFIEWTARFDATAGDPIEIANSVRHGVIELGFQGLRKILATS